jgi:hypothetical protein
MADFLCSHENYYRFNSTCSPLVWNVKVYSVNFDFDHLVEIYRKSGEYGPEERWLDYPEFLKPAQAEYENVKDNLWEWVVEDARRQVMDEDMNKGLWNGTSLNVRYEFGGRSGGWLLMTEFEGYNLTKVDREDFKADLMDQNVFRFEDIRNLYQLVVQNDHDFRTETVRNELEYLAAFNLFENICALVPRPDSTQLTLPI